MYGCLANILEDVPQLVLQISIMLHYQRILSTAATLPMLITLLALITGMSRRGTQRENIIHTQEKRRRERKKQIEEKSFTFIFFAS